MFLHIMAALAIKDAFSGSMAKSSFKNLRNQTSIMKEEELEKTKFFKYMRDEETSRQKNLLEEHMQNATKEDFRNLENQVEKDIQDLELERLIAEHRATLSVEEKITQEEKLEDLQMFLNLIREKKKI